MSTEIVKDPRIRAVEWKDLLFLSKYEVVKELLISLPWLALSIYLAYYKLYFFALACSFIFFLTGLRQVHNAFHYALGIPRFATEIAIFILSNLMLGSMHAVQITHLEHHKYCLDEKDVEAASAKLSGLKAILVGPLFPIRLHLRALSVAKRKQKLWIYSELLATVLLLILAFGYLNIPVLKYHFIAMLIGQCLTSFFAVWTVHHDCDRYYYIARTLRGGVKNFISFNMFFHVEHHLYPKVPTCHLPKLATRLDALAPELKEKQVF
jgi:fatty acid desaturase